MAKALYNRCIFFLADGARADVLRDLLAKGELPNIRKYITAPGTNAQAVTVFPSTTGPAYLPFITGRYPGACNLPGIRWFDRRHYESASPFGLKRTRSYCGPAGWLMSHDLEAHVPTIFELTQKPFNLHNPIDRGLPKGRSRFNMGLGHLIGHYLADHRPAHRGVMEGLLRAVCEDFDYIFVGFPGPDTAGHYHGAFSKRAIESYKEIDEGIGAVCDRLSRIGWLKDTLFFLSADHGMTPTHTHFDLDGFLDRRGFKTYYHPRVFRHWTTADAANMVSGNSMSHLYFKNGKGWSERTAFEEMDGGHLGALADELLGYESLEMLAGVGADGAVRVKSRRGTGRIERAKDGGIHYRIEQGADPFGYGPLPAVMEDRESLQLTSGTEYPDALVQLAQIFESPRTGDLIACARNGHDLRLKFENPAHVGSHGALTRDQMMVPFLTNHPLEFSGAIRTVDFFPTAFRLLGRQAPARLDGIDLTQRQAAREAA